MKLRDCVSQISKSAPSSPCCEPLPTYDETPSGTTSHRLLCRRRASRELQPYLRMWLYGSTTRTSPRIFEPPTLSP